MSDTKVYQFGETGSGTLNSLLPLLQQRGIDPAYIAGLANNNNGGFFGGNAWEGIIALIIVAAIFGNNGNGGIFGNNGNGVASTAEREMLMSAIQRNGTDIAQLAHSIGCSDNAIKDAIGQVSTQICNLAGQNGLSFQQVINSIQAGNSSIVNQLCQCCCKTQTAIQESNYLTERGFCNTNATLTKGFADLGYATRDQTCSIEKAIAASTESILAGQRNAEMREMQREITERDRRIAEQATAINNYQQTQTFGAMITQATAPIANAVNNLQSDVDGIKCRLPRTEVIPATPEYVAVNRSINVPYGPYCTGFGAGFGFSGWNNGNCCGNSLWG